MPTNSYSLRISIQDKPESLSAWKRTHVNAYTLFQCVSLFWRPSQNERSTVWRPLVVLLSSPSANSIIRWETHDFCTSCKNYPLPRMWQGIFYTLSKGQIHFICNFWCNFWVVRRRWTRWFDWVWGLFLQAIYAATFCVISAYFSLIFPPPASISSASKLA